MYAITCRGGSGWPGHTLGAVESDRGGVRGEGGAYEMKLVLVGQEEKATAAWRGPSVLLDTAHLQSPARPIEVVASPPPDNRVCSFSRWNGETANSVVSFCLVIGKVLVLPWGLSRSNVDNIAAVSAL